MSDQLGEILKKTLTAVESGKEEIFFIVETSQTETNRLLNELSQLKSSIKEIILQVDQQEKLDRRMRQKLMEVNRAYQEYSHEDMLKTYEEAKDAQVNLQLLRAKEIQLRKRRDDIALSLRQMQATVERGKTLLTQVGMAIKLLQSGVNEVQQNQSQEQRLEMVLRVIRAQEEERRRVAREIHDGPAQTFANIVLRLEIAEKLLEFDTSRVKAELNDLKNLVRSNLQDIRRIIFDLRPMALDDLGIVPAISKYLDNLQDNYGIICDFKIGGREKRLLPALEVALFRLVQEGITNIAKHANSSKADISLIYQDDWIVVRIQDYGKGFEVDSAMNAPGEHFGLIGMRERVEMFSGHFSIKSTLGKGTIIEFLIPLRQGGEMTT